MHDLQPNCSKKAYLPELFVLVIDVNPELKQIQIDETKLESYERDIFSYLLHERQGVAGSLSCEQASNVGVITAGIAVF